MMKFALIGCGRISKKHVEVLSGDKIPEARITCVCDIEENKAQELGEKLKVPWYTDYHTMLTTENKNIDIVSVLTDSGSHSKIAIDVSKFKKHVIVEKPMALTLKSADQMISSCKDNNVRLFVVKQNRFNPPIQKLREAIDLKKFGKIFLGTIRVRWCRTQEYYDQAAWRGTWEHDGGVFANQASHHIDLLQWMLGDVESVFAKTKRALVDIEAEDTGVVILKFKSGALGIIEATTATRPVDLEGSISVLGEKGTAEIGGFAVNEIKTWNFSDEVSDESLLDIQEYKTNPPNVYGFGHLEFLKDVIVSLQEGKESLIHGEEGRKSLELIAAIYESVETGKEVTLSFSPQKCKLGAGEPEWAQMTH